MNHNSSRIRRTLIGATIALAALAGAPAAAAPRSGPQVPDLIAVDAGNKVFLSAHATGVQIYRCGVTADAFAWTLAAPRAVLVDDKGKQLMTHFEGPRWQTTDGSTVVGRKVDGITVDPSAIQWLLIEPASITDGPTGGDRLAATTFIQRTHTTGGLAPAANTCDAGAIGTVVEVPYTADYHFWKQAGA